MLEQRAAAAVHGAERRQIRRLDVELRAKIAPQCRRHHAQCLQQTAAHAQKANQRQRKLEGGRAPLSIAFARIEELESVITEAALNVEPIPREALFLAGKVFLSYRRGRGTKHSVLPDFYIGAHAAVMQWPILTRDVARYRAYFPAVPVIAP